MNTLLNRMFDLTSGNLNPVVNFEGISKNVVTVGFQVRRASSSHKLETSS